MKKKHRLLLLFCMMVMVLALPLQVQAAKSKITLSGATIPTTIKQGAFFNMKGTIKSANKLKEIRCTLYKSNGTTCLQRFVTYPNSKTYDLRRADPYLYFDKLTPGTYYYRVLCYDTKNYKKRVINKKFTVVGDGKIKIVNPKPSGNLTINEGKAYAIGGNITSTYTLGSVTARILNSSNKAVYSKTVNPKKKTYSLTNSTLDAAMLFDKLSAGTYKFEVTAVDTKRTSVRLIYRTITVKKSSTSSGTNPGSTGGDTTTSGDYLNTDGTVTVPSGYVKRNARPASTNKYYYDKNYNIYYGYNSLAPTGKKMADDKNYVVGNCTWYACGRAMEIVARAGGDINKVKAIFGPDPVGIFNMNVAKRMFQYGSTPKIGALAVFNYGNGGEAHIAVVEDIVNGVPYVSESGYAISTTKPTASTIIFKYQSIYNWAGGRSLKGYIYLR